MRSPLFMKARALSRALFGTPTYDGDNLTVYQKSADFLFDARFRRAYARGMGSGHEQVRRRHPRRDLRIEWRIHTALWAAAHAVKLPGDFVECGVNTGIMALAICDYVDFNATGKSFWLFDTFSGIPEEQINDRERELGRARDASALYGESYELVRANFAPFPSARLVRGKVPDTLPTADIDDVAFLSLDMNIAAPEVAALEFFWDKLVPGAPVLLDDYGWEQFRPQKDAMDAFAAAHDVAIATLPTGQGLLLRPPRA